MAEPFVIDDSNFENDALRQAVNSYKEAMRLAAHDLDVQYFVKTLKAVEPTCPVKVARNPLDKEHEWNPDAKLYNVGKLTVDDEHHLTAHIRKDGVELTAEKALEQIENLKGKLHGMMGPVMLELTDDNKVKLTDVYSHALVENVWAGLPFEVVLGYFEKETTA